MSRLLLHSGKTEHFRALGDTGQPVYHSALQLRKVISRRLPGKERHLAIPQRDQQGEGVDWYSDIQGDVIPWSSATEGEREDARIQLEAFRQQVIALNQESSEGQSGDHEVFSRLVKWVCHFPDEGFVYLVDGIPVITFWGFIHPEADRHANPLLCLHPSISSAIASPTPLSPPEPIAEPEPAFTTPPVTAERSWWQRWWWLLPLLLLALGLLFFGLRACSPSVNTPNLNAAPPLSVMSPDISVPTTSLPGTVWDGVDIWPFNRWNSSSVATPNLVPQGTTGNTGLPATGSSFSGTGLPDASVSAPELPGTASGELPSNVMPATANLDGLPTEPSTTPPLPEPLTLPADAADGSASFLNGNWRGAGVMDNQTGRPLQVTYVFNQGEGHMYIQRGGSAGVTCAGPVAANMQGGQLQVEALEKARCEDDSHYEMPSVQCQQAEGETASCTASYDDEPFPMQLRKAR